MIAVITEHCGENPRIAVDQSDRARDNLSGHHT
ncbi:MAG: hypothetical protein ACI9AO_000819 [Ilumatobacter sp.]|jgi:hypothetical protein